MGCVNSKDSTDRSSSSGKEKKKRRRPRSKRSADERTAMSLAERSHENTFSNSTRARDRLDPSEDDQETPGEFTSSASGRGGKEEAISTSILRNLPPGSFQDGLVTDSIEDGPGRLTIHGPEDDYCAIAGHGQQQRSQKNGDGRGINSSLLQQSQRSNVDGSADELSNSRSSNNITMSGSHLSSSDQQGLETINPLVLVPSRRPPPPPTPLQSVGANGGASGRPIMIQQQQQQQQQPGDTAGSRNSESGSSSKSNNRDSNNFTPKKLRQPSSSDGGRDIEDNGDQQILPFRPVVPAADDPAAQSVAASRTQSSGAKSSNKSNLGSTRDGPPVQGGGGLSISSLPDQLQNSPPLPTFFQRGGNNSSNGQPGTIDQLSSRGSQGSKYDHCSASQRFDNDPLVGNNHNHQAEVYYLSALSTLNPRRDEEVREHLVRNYRGGCNHPTIIEPCPLYLMTPDERRLARHDELAKIHKVAIQQQKYIDEGGVDCPKARKLGKKRNGVLSFEGLLLIHPEYNEALPVAAFLPPEFLQAAVATSKKGIAAEDEEVQPAKKENLWRNALFRAIEASLTVEVSHRVSLATGSKTQEFTQQQQESDDELAAAEASYSSSAETKSNLDSLKVVKRTIKHLAAKVIVLRSDLHKGDFDEVFRTCTEMRTFLFNSKTRATYLSGNSGRISSHLTRLKLALIQEIEVVIKDYQVLTNHADSFHDSLKASGDLENFQVMFLSSEFPNSPSDVFAKSSAAATIPQEYKPRLNRFIATCLWDKVTYSTEALGILIDQELRVVRSKIFNLEQQKDRPSTTTH